MKNRFPSCGSPAARKPATRRGFCVENPHTDLGAAHRNRSSGESTATPTCRSARTPTSRSRWRWSQTPWPGASAEKVEELVTKTIEKVIASNTEDLQDRIGFAQQLSVITFSISDDLKDSSTVLDDIGGRLAAIHNLPEGAGPIQLRAGLRRHRDPDADGGQPQGRAGATSNVRAGQDPRGDRGHPAAAPSRPGAPRWYSASRSREDYRLTRHGRDRVRRVPDAVRRGARSVLLDGAGCVGADVHASRPDERDSCAARRFLRDELSAVPVGARRVAAFRRPDLAEVRAKLASVAGEKYSYRELDDFTDIMEKALLAAGRKDVDAPLVAKVDRSGILPKRCTCCIRRSGWRRTASSRARSSNILRGAQPDAAAGEFDAGGKNVLVESVRRVS